MWRQHGSSSCPSHHALRATCMQLLPLVEMYCKWELLEDCSNLRALMRRFDSEAALESHELGRSMLQMLHDDDVGMFVLPPRAQFSAPIDPFDDIKSSLVVVHTSFQALQPQVHVGFVCHSSGSIQGIVVMPLCATFCLCSHCPTKKLNKCRFMHSSSLETCVLGVLCAFNHVCICAHILCVPFVAFLSSSLKS